MRQALGLAKRGYGKTSPNPMVGAILTSEGRIVGQGWHRGAGRPHAEVEAIRDAQRRGHALKGSTLYVTLEPCCTYGRTPPCTEPIIAVGIRRVVCATTDPNPRHMGRGYKRLRNAGIEVSHGLLADEAARLSEAFNHWIVHRTPFVTVKAAMTLDGKIATASGESKWITGEKARSHAMRLRQGVDAILVGINTVLLDNPSLTVRKANQGHAIKTSLAKRRIILDSAARTPPTAEVVQDSHRSLTTIVVSQQAPARRIQRLARAVTVWAAPEWNGALDLQWVLKRLGEENVTHLLVEGGGEVNASFLSRGLAQRVAFYYAPKIIGGREARKPVAGRGLENIQQAIRLHGADWRRLGQDLFMTARLEPNRS